MSLGSFSMVVVNSGISRPTELTTAISNFALAVSQPIKKVITNNSSDSQTESQDYIVVKDMVASASQKRCNGDTIDLFVIDRRRALVHLLSVSTYTSEQR